MKTKARFIYAAFASAMLAIVALTAHGAPGDLFVSINGTGENGASSINQYTPDGVTIFASGLSRPRGMAFNRSGNLFVANTTFDGINTFQASIVKITPGGVQSTFVTLSGNLFAEGVVFDHAGNLFVAAIDQTDPNAYGPSTISKIAPNGVQNTFGTLPYQGFGLAFDSAGNLFAADAGHPGIEGTASIYKFAPDGSRSVFVDQSAFPFTGPVGLSFDRFGNLFASTEADVPMGTDTIVKFTPDGVGSTFATDLDYPRGLAFDRSGILFVAERGAFAPPGDILKFKPDGNSRVFAAELDDPHFLAFRRR